MRSMGPLRRILILSAVLVLAGLLASGVGYLAYSFSRVPVLFRLNAECQKQGYYMGDFEFKMLGLAYYLDKGRILEAVRRINGLHRQLKTKEGLLKVPAFSGPQEELDFYLGLQNPRTGAFMDDSYPYVTYEGPTGNVLLHLEALAAKAGVPLKLRYPLSFFDRIATPQALAAYLDDAGRIGFLASKLPESTFHMVRDHAAYLQEGNVLERNGLYAFSPEWKRALLAWFTAHQDEETGFWGPLDRRSGKLLKVDLSNTASIIQAFLDPSGRERYPDFPLHRRDRIFATTLDLLARPSPPKDEEDQIHGWNLAMDKGIKMLLRYLWREAGEGQKEAARGLFEGYLRLKFADYYLPDQGAFAYYPASGVASLDGTGGAIGLLRDLGAFSRKKQESLWGPPPLPLAAASVPGEEPLSRALARAMDAPLINSIRVYPGEPRGDNPAAAVAIVIYPHQTPCLDAADLVPRVRAWLEEGGKGMGNWTSREMVLEGTGAEGIEPPLVVVGKPREADLEALLAKAGGMTAVGYDVLQVPRRRVDFRGR